MFASPVGRVPVSRAAVVFDATVVALHYIGFAASTYIIQLSVAIFYQVKYCALANGYL